MDYNIYTLGDIDFVWSAFTGIALIFSQYTGVKEFLTTAAVVAGVSLFYKTWLWLQAPTKNELPFFSWFLGFILFMMAMVRVDVTIESVKSGEVRNVDGIPIFIAAMATVTTNLSQGLLKDYKTAFDPLSPVDLSATTLDDDITLGPMIRFVKFLQWGGDSQGYCSAFPEPASGLGPMNVCATVQSLAYNCLKATQNSSANIAGKETIFNDIFSANLADSMDRINQAMKGALKNASASIVGANGSKSGTCDEVWSTVKQVTSTAEARQTISLIGQTNGILTPDEANGAPTGASFTDVMASANGMYGKAIGSYDATLNLFIMNELRNGASKYKTPLGLASDMQLFEASLKRTNTMASQGQLWLQLSGAAIAFLEMFAYMVAPFALLMLLALGGNGVAAAAKYLQLILFVNMWPLTAVMVNAYVKKVATADLDTWSTLNSQNNAVTWMGLPGLAETYSSYLSVASALYALIPVLTLFLMTQSIHPMMNAVKGVTPDAPVDTGHVTPKVWDGPNSGKSSFGDVTRTALTSTGQGYSDGGAVDSSNFRLGMWNAGSSIANSQGQGSAVTSSVMSAASNSFQAGYSQMSEIGRSGQSSQQFSTNLQTMKQISDKIGASVAEGIATKHGVSASQMASIASNVILNAGLNGGVGTGNGAGLKAAVAGQLSSGASKTNTGSDSLSNDLSKAITNQLSQDSALTDQFSKAASQVSSDQISNTNAFKEASSKMNQATQTMAQNISTSVSTNASSNSGMSLDSKQSINLDRFSDSIRNKNFSDDDVRNFARKNGLDENAFMEKFNSYNDTFKASNQLGSQLQRTDALVAATRDFSEQKIAIDTARGETAESNKQDLRETSSLLKSLVSDFGGNAQQLLPITNQLDRISGDGSGINTITQAQDRIPDSVNTSGVMSASRVGELGGSVDSQAKLGLSSNAQDATQHVPGKSEAGFTPYNLDNAGKGDIQGIHNNNVGRTYSDEERNVLNSLEKNGPVLNNQGVEKVVNSGQDVRNAEGTFNDLEKVGGRVVGDGMDQRATALNSMYQSGQVRGLSNNTDNYFSRVANNPNLSRDDKRAELAQQAVFTYGASTMATGAEREQLKADTQKILNELGNYNVNWSMNDVKSIHSSFNTHNRADGSLESVVRANLGEGGSGGGLVGNRTQTVTDRLVGEKIEANTERGAISGALLGGQQFVSDTLTSVGAKPVNEMLTGAGILQTQTSIANDASNPANMPDSLQGKVLNHMQMSDGVAAVSDRYQSISSDGVSTYANAAQNSERAIRQQLTDDPRFGPQKADEFIQYMKSELSNTNEPYQSRVDKADQWLNENKK
ncbi:conjugal transfer protein TraG N-terminal domain-containing protein [Enterobacter hormaechei]|uniref:conjugal transfer protein TraG N-terminal domain-containing protein n=1 Tax=Enterobacter hormaechei TaxID=158836 RepID=UPI0015EC8E7C|nr:conjugal transfer protein TraG N-terminal domain-containing protein [Enterobacter hormaechei]MBA2805659.1 conjugal transfer protein TraG N-terminal domain-containing protein [Enterobacter hormaechei]MCC2889458.1 conjugal transfer protein TraG N-terminal domain-containing protein [Enterobacter hormaechei]QMI63675.1 conjugal transfer protein TraG N-terminal domain-containing protein [Enterobacter hormaechei]QMI73309.1 conjugal transfer protein TraG N-terminal domain-containing protein [Enterob